MLNFKYSIPTEIFFGKDQVKVLGKEIKKYGSKVLLVYGGGSIKKNGIYDRVTSILNDEDIEYYELAGVEPNPRIATVRYGIEICRNNDIDFVLAVGGGSTIDCAKVIASGFYYEGDAWDIVLDPSKVKDEGHDLAPLKPVIIHAQMLGKDQIKDVAELGMIPSFFLAHIYHWGDIHIKNLGMDRASVISPAKSALDSSLKFTLHQDSPVILPDMIETLSVAVNRKTKSGVTLGESEKISIKDALEAITINPASQYFEDDIKGSIEKGKKADFVILSENPLTVSDDEIEGIKVLKTVKDGKVVFSRES